MYLLSGAGVSAGLLRCTYFPVQVALQDYWDVLTFRCRRQCRTIAMHFLSGAGGGAGLNGTLTFWCRWQCRTSEVHLLSGAGGSAGLTGALGGATGLSNQAAEVAVIRHTVQVRPVNQLIVTA